MLKKAFVWFFRIVVLIPLSVALLWWVYLFVSSRIAHDRVLELMNEGQVASAIDGHAADVFTLKTGEKIVVKSPIFAHFSVSQDIYNCGELCKNVGFATE